LNRKRIYIASAGIVSALGNSCTAVLQSLEENRTGLQPLQLFSLLQGEPLPVGEVRDISLDDCLPRSHQLACKAAAQAMQGQQPADALVLATTTGGILRTEQLLCQKENDPKAYQYHGLTTVAEEVAVQSGCTGQLLTVSTACSSGAVAIALAMSLLRSGQAQQVLVGGVDSLCRLTYFGFHSLQLVDPAGARPLDENRQGMSVAEGAAMLLLTTKRPEEPLAELAGFGLSCDAHHPAAPRPDGRGAVRAMRSALADAGIRAAEIDYINLHGTGTPDNDQAESRAIRSLYGDQPLPPLSSCKGTFGHSLAASGVIEAIVAGMAVKHGLLPANSGCQWPDPQLVQPLLTPTRTEVRAVLSNSFGFGGNNGSLCITEPDHFARPANTEQQFPLTICGMSCLTGAGDLTATVAALGRGESAAGLLPLREVSALLPQRQIRRLKRLARLALALSVAAHAGAVNKGLTENQKPSAVFMGTGWGALSETCDFLTRLEESREQFPSPIDFIGSVHNGAAGQVAIHFQATSTNITVSGGDYSFEQALLTAELIADEQPCLVIGADEGHEPFSRLFDPSTDRDSPLADGGGAFCLQRGQQQKKTCIQTLFYQNSDRENCLQFLIHQLGGTAVVRERYDLVLAGIPAATRQQAATQLQQFRKLSGITVPVIDYRQQIGQFASASAVAAVMAAVLIEQRTIPAGLVNSEQDLPCTGSILILGLGSTITAMECSPS
jgi:3-oxoacyl-(acyl-carrier-protein) synthase